MTRIPSPDRRSVKTRQALRTAFRQMLTIKAYRKITITDLAEEAGIARHTFYNHFQSKEDLLDILIDSVLEGFFRELEGWDFFSMDPDQELAMFTAFFQTWKDHKDISDLLKNPELEMVITERLKAFFTRLFHQKIKAELPEISFQFAKYVINFNAYSLVGLLKPWIESGMKASPDHLAGFLLELTGSQRRLQAVRAYQRILSV